VRKVVAQSGSFTYFSENSINTRHFRVLACFNTQLPVLLKAMLEAFINLDFEGGLRSLVAF